MKSLRLLRNTVISPQYSAYCNLTSTRQFHDSNDRYKLIPSLMDFPVPVRPKFSHTIRNFIFSQFIIRPYYDQEFRPADFLDGAKSAVDFVSQCLSEGDLDAIEDSDVITDSCLHQLKLNLSLFSHNQQERLFISKNDIFYNFIYQIGVILDDHDAKKRHVEITYVVILKLAVMSLCLTLLYLGTRNSKPKGGGNLVFPGSA